MLGDLRIDKDSLKFPQIETERLILRMLEWDEAEQFLNFMGKNRDHFAPFAPPEPEDFYTVEYWQKRIVDSHAQYLAGTALRLAIFTRDGQTIVGDTNYTQIYRGPFNCCSLGYKIDHEFQGKGMMREALEAGIEYVFSHLRLHRIQANYLLNNDRSAALLNRLGFRIEGEAKNYLFINGAWRDHVLTSKTNPSPVPPEVS